MPEITDPKVESHLWYELSDVLVRDAHPGAQLLRQFQGVLRAGARQHRARMLVVGNGIEDWQAMSLARMDGQHLSACFMYVRPDDRGEDMFYQLLEEIHYFGAQHQYEMFGVPCPVLPEEGALMSMHDLFGPPRAVIARQFEMALPTFRTGDPKLKLVYYTLPRKVVEEELLF